MLTGGGSVYFPNTPIGAYSILHETGAKAYGTSPMLPVPCAHWQRAKHRGHILPFTESTRRSLSSWYSSGSFIKTGKCCPLLLALLQAFPADFSPRPRSRTNSGLSFDVNDVRRTEEGGVGWGGRASGMFATTSNLRLFDWSPAWTAWTL